MSGALVLKISCAVGIFVSPAGFACLSFQGCTVIAVNVSGLGAVAAISEPPALNYSLALFIVEDKQCSRMLFATPELLPILRLCRSSVRCPGIAAILMLCVRFVVLGKSFSFCLPQNITY